MLSAGEKKSPLRDATLFAGQRTRELAGAGEV